MSLGSLAAVGGLLCLVLLYWRERAKERRKRAQFFAGCLDLFQSYRVVQENGGYPVLTGSYRGLAVRLEPIVDDMACRKVPILWLKVSVLQSIPYRGVLDFLMRPAGTEFYSPSAHLDYDLEIPPSWPQNAILRSDAPEALPPLDLVGPHIEMFTDTDRKELVITPKGVRLVARVWQASRPHYLILREIRFDDHRLDRGVAAKYLDATVAIVRALVDTPPLRRVA